MIGFKFCLGCWLSADLFVRWIGIRGLRVNPSGRRRLALSYFSIKVKL